MSTLTFDFPALQNLLEKKEGICNAVQAEVGGELPECSVFDIRSLAAFIMSESGHNLLLALIH